MHGKIRLSEFGAFLTKHWWWAVGVLIVVCAVECFGSLPFTGITNDEAVKISSGYAHWRSGRVQFNLEHPPLIKLIAAFPLVLANMTLSFDDADRILLYARMPMILLTVAFALLVFVYARELFGIGGGLCALTLFVFNPDLIAHGRLVATDVGLSLFVFLTNYLYWKFVRSRSKMMLVGTGVSAGCALAAKFSGIFVLPMLVILGGLHLFYVHSNGKGLIRSLRKDLLILLVSWLIIIALAATVLCATYFFADIQAYLAGFKAVIEHSKNGHSAFLLGDHRTDGWWYYFLVALLVKMPLGGLLLFLYVAVLWIIDKRTRAVEAIDDWFIVVPIIIFFGIMVASSINIGVRHILPIYPFLFLFAARTMRRSSSYSTRLTAGLLIAWYVLSSVQSFPNYLAYFNEIAGGPKNGPNILLDSNIDWGQDLGNAAKWLRARNIKKVYLSYSGVDSAEYRGIDRVELDVCPEPKAGVYVISVNHLVGLTADLAACYQVFWKYFSPIARIGYSIYIYNLAGDDVSRLTELRNKEREDRERFGRSKARIVAWGPQKTAAGKLFGVQPNKNASMWFQIENAKPGMLVFWQDIPLKTVYDRSSLYTAEVPKRLLAAEGKYQLYLVDFKRKEKTEPVVFVIVAR